MIRILIADDHPMYRAGVSRTLSDTQGMHVVAEASDAASALALAVQHHPDVVLLDISMPGGGMAALQGITALSPAPRVAMLTASEEDDDLFAALQGGAAGYILKGIGARDLVAVVQGIAAGQDYVPPALAARLLHRRATAPAPTRRSPVDALTKREEDVLRLVARGQSNREIGQVLALQEKTVKHYMTTILQKLGLRNRVEAALLARAHFDITAPDALSDLGPGSDTDL